MDVRFSTDQEKFSSTGVKVSAGLFGANMLFDRDFIQAVEDEPGAFAHAVDELGVATLRYPGGSITEDYFDILHPNSKVQNGIEVTPLDEFIAFCGKRGIDAIIVIPTARFVDETSDKNGNRLEKVPERAIYNFVTSVLKQASQSDARIDAFEIGNEWYMRGLTATEYGRIASRITAITQKAIDDYREEFGLKKSVEPNIIVQVGHLANADKETREIYRQFNAEEIKALDGLVTHRYLNGPYEFIGSSGVSRPYLGQFESWADLMWLDGRTKSLETYVTEWNVRGGHADETGLRAASSMIALFGEMLSARVDSAAIWAIQQNNAQNLTVSNGGSSGPGSIWKGLSINGAMFEMMQESLPGLQYIKSNVAARDAEKVGVDLQAFLSAADGKSVIFASSRSQEMSKFDLDVHSLMGDAKYAYVEILGVGNGSDPTDANARPVLERYFQNALENGKVHIQLDPWEVARVTVSSDSLGKAIAGTLRADRINTTFFDDTVHARAGDDLVQGFSGDDRIYAGTGSDSVRGDDGNDSIYLGGGNDYAYGGDGNDYLSGGAGQDRLKGGAGNDTLIGGAGQDTLMGGVGQDTFIFGRGTGDIAYGLSDDDIVILRDGTTDFSQISLSESDGNTIVHGKNCSFTLMEITPEDLDIQKWLLG